MPGIAMRRADAMTGMADNPLVLIRGTLPTVALEELRDNYPTRMLPADAAPAALGAERDQVRAIATLGTVPTDDAFMAALPALEMISVFGVGFDGIALDAAQRRAIRVTNTPDVLTEDTADYAMALVLALSRRLIAGDRHIRAGNWGKVAFPDGARLRSRTLGIVGMGRIGQSLARRATAFGMAVEWHGPRPKPELPYRFHDALVDLSASADYLVLCCPGGPATAGIVDADVLRVLGPEKYLVNVSRGTVVDQDALVAALVGGQLAGAALDVFRNEPDVPAALLPLENVILEPHIASTTAETRREVGRLMVQNLKDHFGGRPLGGRVVC